MTVHVAEKLNDNDLQFLNSLQLPAPWSAKTDSVSRSWSDLSAVMAEITSKSTSFDSVDPESVVGWVINPDTNSVQIGVTSMSSELETAADAAFGRGAVTFVLRPQIFPANSRTNETGAPYHAGGRIWLPAEGVHCTAGFAIIVASTRYMLTAGHCGDGTGNSVVQTNTNPVTIGSVVHRTLSNNGWDTEYYSGSFSPYVWVGSINSTTGHRTTGSSRPAVGQGGVCSDGSFTGENCNGVVMSNEGVCVQNIQYSTPRTICNLAELRSQDGSTIVQRGDSGGPIYTDFNGTLKAVGSIVADGTSIGTGQYVYYHPIPDLLSKWGATLVTN